MRYRSECRCQCHDTSEGIGGLIHVMPCCQPDPEKNLFGQEVKPFQDYVVTGVNRVVQQRVCPVEENLLNKQKLDKCTFHRFAAAEGFSPYRVCMRCEGKLSFMEAHWYELGVEHGGIVMGDDHA